MLHGSRSSWPRRRGTGRDALGAVREPDIGHAASWATSLEDLTTWWLAEVAQAETVRVASRRAAYAFARVAGVDPVADDSDAGAVLTVPSSIEGVARATSANRADLVQGLNELRAAGLITEHCGVLVLGGAR